MGFYAPSQLVQDARRHGVEVLPVDVTASEWDCTLEPGILKTGTDPIFSVAKNGDRPHFLRRAEKPGAAPLSQSPIEKREHFEHSGTAPALRLGLRMAKSLDEASARRLVAERARKAFADAHDLAERARLDRRALAALARAGALHTLAGHRRQAAWQVMGIERSDAPLLAQLPVCETPVRLQTPSEAQEIVADYASLGLSLRRHPLALLRSNLRQRRLLKASRIQSLPHGRLARTAGIVTCRQRPDTAAGVIFLTLEDETGTLNVVVWRDLMLRQRREVLGARLLGVYGTIEREAEVVQVIAGRLIDLTPLLGALEIHSRDFH
jgi:error-prone DNA polymerase